jgi:hypothetical protein
MDLNDDERGSPFLDDEDSEESAARHSVPELPICDGEALQAFEL